MVEFAAEKLIRCMLTSSNFPRVPGYDDEVIYAKCAYLNMLYWKQNNDATAGGLMVQRRGFSMCACVTPSDTHRQADRVIISLPSDQAELLSLEAHFHLSCAY